ncbi:MAG: ChuX/HutX family heme-like substrate-binding protein [Pseudomonadota bacterium]
MIKILAFAAFALAAGSNIHTSAQETSLNIADPIEACADADTREVVQRHFQKNTKATLAGASRKLALPELLVVTGLPPEQAIGTQMTPEILKDVWTSMDAWGEQASVRTVFTMGGEHVLEFPGYIPVRQADLDDGWLDIYADGGAGVHGHLWLNRVGSAHAIERANKNKQLFRSISFYAPEGHLIMGVYASVPGTPADPKAVEGFERTRALLASMPRLCER